MGSTGAPPVEARPLEDDQRLWVFAYGSLMWNPGFTHQARERAKISGWNRRLCIWSHVYRGTPERPGLVLGLDTGGECVGVAFHVEHTLRQATVDYLRARELVTDVYIETTVEAVLDSGERVSAVTYVCDRGHRQYAPPMSRTQALEVIRNGYGVSGHNAEYVLNTHAHLVDLGIRDEELEWLAGRLGGAEGG